MNIRSIHTDQEPDGDQDANLDAAVPFISLGSATQAVVLRLQSRLPRIRVSAGPPQTPGGRVEKGPPC